MKSQTAFTKKDLVVVLGCIVFLLANIAAISEGGRKRAQAAVCLSNLLKWGQIFQAYTADNDGFFHNRGFGYSNMWPYVYKPYYQDPLMRFCPTATNPNLRKGTFGTWNFDIGAWHPDPIPGEGQPLTGSYGMNRYIENMKVGSFGTDPAYWRRTDVKGGDKAPVLMDCMYVYYWANSIAEPPAYNGDYTTPEMHWICIDRHLWYNNVVFLDSSARKVGLKELWALRHTRPIDKGFNPCDKNGWTICGFSGNKTACKAAWDAAAPWMSKLPVY
jgi:hypothetical protein